ncbi:LCP family protein [Eggerthella sinensis]|uniref:LCP family protein n=1 Tax=Eggerthella sinensis TaxID=242230 RepID=UPI0022E104E6|nr:LCP family protein [Eggerthella sinensis]
MDTILPTTASGESSSQYARRVSRREFTQDIQRKARIRRILVLAVCLVVVACVAVGVGVATFFGSLDGKLALKNSDASLALIAPKADAKAYYTLVSADLDLPGSASAQDGPDAFALVRVDQASRTVTVVSIPPTLQVSLKDGKTHPLRDAQTQEGDASLITAVSNFAGVDVAHYVKTDAEGIAKLVDALGGIEVNVAEEVDDPNAGDAYLPAGTQVLDGAKTLTLLRASNFADGLDVQTANQRAVLTALSLRLLGDGSLGFLTTLDGRGRRVPNRPVGNRGAFHRRCDARHGRLHGVRRARAGLRDHARRRDHVRGFDRRLEEHDGTRGVWRRAGGGAGGQPG